MDADLLRGMAARLAHRGPDDRGFFSNGPVGLAHTRLSIVDLTGGHQPLTDDAKGLALIANGEIYNDPELREELARVGERFATRSDSESILRAYSAWGDTGIGRLHGMFAFALYDRPRARLILARDRLGMKPLYVLRRPDRLLFASELKALLPHCPTVEWVPEALVQYLGHDYSSGRQTLVRGIERVLPGETWIVERDLSVKRQAYWCPESVEPRQGRYEDFAAEFDELIGRVIREHLRSDVPLGLFLSGGVDSSLLLALLSRSQDRPVRTFSVGFVDAVDSELPAAEAAARRFGAEHTALLLDRAVLVRRLPHVLWAADDLVLDPALLPTSRLAEAAGRERKVIFTGEGGDEAFAGYARYRHPALARWLRALTRPGTGGFRTGSRWPRSLARYVFGPDLQRARRVERKPLVDAWQATPGDWTSVMRAQHTDLKTMLADQLCPKVDRMLMAFGVEGRVPWLDHRVVEFGLALPDDLKIAPHQGKLFLKRWARQFYSAEHLDQPKRGFSVPMGQFLQGPLLDRMAERLPTHPALQPWFQAEGVARLIERQRADGRVTTLPLWALLQLAIWHRIFIEGNGEPPPLEAEPADWL